MSTLTRDDGTQFVIHAYRELTSLRKKSQVAQKLRKLATQQGQFVHLHRCANEYEAVFSPEPGYLLGESIRNYFPKMQNLLFFEAFNGDNQFLFIVIRDGKVFIDSLLSLEEIKIELLPLTVLNTRFHVMMSGRLPEEMTDFKQGFIPEAIIDAIEYSKEPLLPTLPVSENTRLIPLHQTLKAKRLEKSAITPVLLATLFAVGLVTLSIYVNQRKNATNSVSYQQYQHALVNPSPEALLSVLATVIKNHLFIPNWEITEILQTSNDYEIKLITDKGQISTLQILAARNHEQLRITDQYALLQSKFATQKRDRIYSIYPLDDINAQIIDQMQQLFENSDATIHEIIRRHQTREATMTLTLNEITPQQLINFGKVLSKLPIVLQKTRVAIAKDALLNVQLQLSAWGT